MGSNHYRFDLAGAQTGRNIRATHERLSAALAEHQTIEIHCEAITEFDFTLIQLLLSAKASAKRAGRSLVLAAPVAGRLRVALDRAGFLTNESREGESCDMFWS
jgi:anti-anti-sigma regulatory factor